MFAITTKFIPPSDTEGAKILGTFGDNRVILNYRSNLDSESNHSLAAQAVLRNKVSSENILGEYGNFDNWVAGSLENGYVFVFAGIM